MLESPPPPSVLNPTDRPVTADSAVHSAHPGGRQVVRRLDTGLRAGSVRLGPSTGGADAGPTPLQLQEIVAAINTAAHHRGLARCLHVARIIVERIYGGNPAAFRSREGKAVSLRRLADNGVPLSPAALYRCLSVHEIWVRVDGSRWPRLAASHYRAVESLVPELQEPWLRKAAERAWSAASLRESIRAAGARVTARGGRLPEHPMARFVARVERELAKLDQVTPELGVSADERAEMRRVASALDAIAMRCRAHAQRVVRSMELPVFDSHRDRS